MRLFWEETKKIWRLPVIAIIIVVNILLFYMLLSDQLRYSYNEEGEQRVIADLCGIVGDTLEPEELPEAHRILEQYYDDVTAIMQSDPVFIEAGLTNGEELWIAASTIYVDIDEDARVRVQLQSDLATEFVFGKYLEPSDYAYWKIQALNAFLNEYKRFETRDFADSFGVTFTGASAEKLKHYAEADAHRNIFSARSYEDAVNFFSVCALIVVVSVGVLVLPYLTTDNQHGLPQMQWCAKTGRRTLRTQFAAVLVSSGALALALPAIYSSLFLSNRPEYFSQMERPIFTVLGHIHYLSFNPLFWQLIVVAISLCAELGLGASGIFFFLSRHSDNYISELLKAIPVGAAVAVLGAAVLFMLFSESNYVGRFLKIPGAELFTAGIYVPEKKAKCMA